MPLAERSHQLGIAARALGHRLRPALHSLPPLAVLEAIELGVPCAERLLIGHEPLGPELWIGADLGLARHHLERRLQTAGLIDPPERRRRLALAAPPGLGWGKNDGSAG